MNLANYNFVIPVTVTRQIYLQSINTPLIAALSTSGRHHITLIMVAIFMSVISSNNRTIHDLQPSSSDNW